MESINHFLEKVLSIKKYSVIEFTTGKDNKTYGVFLENGNECVIQKLSFQKKENTKKFIESVIDYSQNITGIRFAKNFFSQRFYEYEGSTYQVMEKLPGKTIEESDIDTGIVIKTAQYIAQFHNGMRNFQSEPYKENNYYRRVFEFRDTAKTLIENSGDKEVQDIFSKMNSHIFDVKEDVSLPRGVIFGDPAFKNFLIDTDKNIVGLIDYDMLSVTTLLWDVADMIRGYLKVAIFDEKHFHILLESYNAIRPFTNEERQKLKDYCKMMIGDTGFRYIISYLDPQLQKNFLGSTLEKAKRCVHEMEKIDSFF